MKVPYNCKRKFILFSVFFIFLYLVLSIFTYNRRNKVKRLHSYDFLISNMTCDVRCETGTPCEYPIEVDFRIIVMTYKRAHGLRKTLNSLESLVLTMDDLVTVDIWIDRSVDGTIDASTENVAMEFNHTFSYELGLGLVCIHYQTKNAGIRGQWVDTWRPRENTKEIALILEDDISVSPYAYKWLKTVVRKYENEADIAGYTLQMELTNFGAGDMGMMYGPSKHQVFLYAILGTWGYAPHPKSWREYQDWLKEVRPDRNLTTDKIKPYVDGIIHTKWYQQFEQTNTTENMWEMWHIKYCELFKKFTVYSNLRFFSPNPHTLLSTNRMEEGLHFAKNAAHDDSVKLLRIFDPSFEKLPPYKELSRFNYDGSLCTPMRCFNVTK